MKNNINLSLITLAFLITTNSLLAKPPQSSEILRGATPNKEKQSLETLVDLKLKEFKPAIKDKKGVKIKVKDFTFVNNTVFSDEVLLSLVNKYKNKSLSISEIKYVADLITQYYRENKYFVARAYIPAQELQEDNAIIKINIIEEYYDKFHLKNSSLLKDEIVQNYLNQVKKDPNIINLKKLERQLLLLDELKGVHINNVQILPAKKIGYSDLLIESLAENKYLGHIEVDNYGNEYTGKYRLNVVGDINSLSNRGDSLGINALVSNTSDLKNLQIEYNTPLSTNGLKLNLKTSGTKYKIGKEFASQKIKGDSLDFNLSLSYPLIKQRSHSLNTSLSYHHNKAKDENILQENKKTLNSFSLGLDFLTQNSFFNKQGMFTSSLAFTKGKISLNSADAKANDALLNSKGAYEKINLSLSQTQVLSSNFSITVDLKAQKALNKNLDGQEDFFIEEVSGANQHTRSRLSGDTGYNTTLALSYRLPNINGISHKLSAFASHGRVWVNEKKISNDNIKDINFAGLEYLLGYKQVSLKLSYSHIFKHSSDIEHKDLDNVYAQLIWNF